MPLIILDRDGVINADSDAYIKSPSEWRALPGSLEAIARLNRSGYRVVVVTNQSGIARGLLSIDMLNRIHEKMNRELEAAGGQIEAIFYCPHGPEDGCLCRKPQPGMLYDLARRLNLALADVPVVGDSIRDLKAAAAVGADPILVRTGKGAKSEALLAQEGMQNVPVFNDLAAVAHVLLDT